MIVLLFVTASAHFTLEDFYLNFYILISKEHDTGYVFVVLGK